MRRKRIAINCHADLFFGEGKIKIKDFFPDLDPLMKVDLLRDWKTDIDNLHDEAIKEWRKSLGMKSNECSPVLEAYLFGT